MSLSKSHWKITVLVTEAVNYRAAEYNYSLYSITIVLYFTKYEHMQPRACAMTGTEIRVIVFLGA